MRWRMLGVAVSWDEAHATCCHIAKREHACLGFGVTTTRLPRILETKRGSRLHPTGNFSLVCEHESL